MTLPYEGTAQQTEIGTAGDEAFRPMGLSHGLLPSCCGARQPRRLTEQACVLPTAATRSPRFICHRQRSVRSPFESHHPKQFRI